VSLLAASICISKEERRPLCIDSIESVALFGWFLFIPALWAIGCYFALWHSLRHTLRILSTDTTGSQLLDSKQYLKLNMRWLQLTGLMTLIALIGMWIIFRSPLFRARHRTGLVGQGFDWHIGLNTPAHCSGLLYG
jgi:Brp/Blh family beta-carotene 15,15'-monooxygenase